MPSMLHEAPLLHAVSVRQTNFCRRPSTLLSDCYWLLSLVCLAPPLHAGMTQQLHFFAIIKLCCVISSDQCAKGDKGATSVCRNDAATAVFCNPQDLLCYSIWPVCKSRQGQCKLHRLHAAMQHSTITVLCHIPISFAGMRSSSAACLFWLPGCEALLRAFALWSRAIVHIWAPAEWPTRLTWSSNEYVYYTYIIIIIIIDTLEGWLSHDHCHQAPLLIESITHIHDKANNNDGNRSDAKFHTSNASSNPSVLMLMILLDLCHDVQCIPFQGCRHVGWCFWMSKWELVTARPPFEQPEHLGIRCTVWHRSGFRPLLIAWPWGHSAIWPLSQKTKELSHRA